ncbi:MAG: helix-turn-helix transcriptional regulator [Lachnospiraceae bacterium]|nr:helix-turn-helix transcriptional regulator [Lachnospiraceae bacterium]
MAEHTYKMTELGYALKEYRVRNNITQLELARKIGVSANTIHLWETHCCKPAMSSLVILSDILDEPLVEIIVKARKMYN